MILAAPIDSNSLRSPWSIAHVRTPYPPTRTSTRSRIRRTRAGKGVERPGGNSGRRAISFADATYPVIWHCCPRQAQRQWTHAGRTRASVRNTLAHGCSRARFVSSPGGSSFQLYPHHRAFFFTLERTVLSIFFIFIFFLFSRPTFFGRPIELRPGTTSLKSPLAKRRYHVTLDRRLQKVPPF